MFGHLTRIYHYVLSVGIMLRSSDLHLISTLIDILKAYISIFICGSRIKENAIIVVPYHHCGIGNIRMFTVSIAILGVFIHHTNVERALFLAHHLYIICDADTVRFLTVDGNTALLGDIDIEPIRIKPQHHRGAVTVSKGMDG